MQPSLTYDAPNLVPTHLMHPLTTPTSSPFSRSSATCTQAISSILLVVNQLVSNQESQLATCLMGDRGFPLIVEKGRRKTNDHFFTIGQQDDHIPYNLIRRKIVILERENPQLQLTHQHNMNRIEPNPRQRVAYHVGENGDFLIRSYLALPLELPHHFNVSVFIVFPYYNLVLYTVTHDLWLKRKQV